MNFDVNGRFVVVPNEQITVVVSKAKDLYLAQIDPVMGGPSWQSQMMTGPLVEMRVVAAPSASGALFTFDIRFDFRPDGSGAHDLTDFYTVQISGNASGSAAPDTITPPPIKIQGYAFVTS